MRTSKITETETELIRTISSHTMTILTDQRSLKESKESSLVTCDTPYWMGICDCNDVIHKHSAITGSDVLRTCGTGEVDMTSIEQLRYGCCTFSAM